MYFKIIRVGLTLRGALDSNFFRTRNSWNFLQKYANMHAFFSKNERYHFSTKQHRHFFLKVGTQFLGGTSWCGASWGGAMGWAQCTPTATSQQADYYWVPVMVASCVVAGDRLFIFKYWGIGLFLPHFPVFYGFAWRMFLCCNIVFVCLSYNARDRASIP